MSHPYRTMAPVPIEPTAPTELCWYDHDDCMGRQWVCLEPKGHDGNHVASPITDDIRCRKRANALGHAKPTLFGHFRCVRPRGHKDGCQF